MQPEIRDRLSEISDKKLESGQSTQSALHDLRADYRASSIVESVQNRLGRKNLELSTGDIKLFCQCLSDLFSEHLNFASITASTTNDWSLLADHHVYCAAEEVKIDIDDPLSYVWQTDPVAVLAIYLDQKDPDSPKGILPLEISKALEPSSLRKVLIYKALKTGKTYPLKSFSHHLNIERYLLVILLNFGDLS